MCARRSTIRTLLFAWLASRSARTAPANPAPTIRKSNPRIRVAPWAPDRLADERLHASPCAIPGGLGQVLVHGAQPGGARLVVRSVLGHSCLDRRDEARRVSGNPDQA